MKSIIIAAGSGRRIPEFSKLIPKSLIKINNKPLLKRQIDLMIKCKINKIAIVKGFKSNKINFKKIKYFYNKNYKKNEQLDSLFYAKEWFNDDVLITFSDIIYENSVIKKIIKSKHNFTIGIQKNWKIALKKPNEPKKEWKAIRVFLIFIGRNQNNIDYVPIRYF